MTDSFDVAARPLLSCLADVRTGSFVLYASEALFIFDYSLTLSDEVVQIWKAAGLSVGTVLFLGARYLGFASCILSLFNQSVSLNSAMTCLRMVTIISSELILGMRTWAIWGRQWWVFGVLLITGSTAIGLAGATVHRDIETSFISTSLPNQLETRFDCQLVKSAVGAGWIVPYILTITFETVTASLMLARIIWWRTRVPQSRRVPLLNKLWQDGVIYFLFMIGVGIANAVFVTVSKSPQARQSVSQLQTTMHSVLSTRAVLHLASSGVATKTMHSDSSVLSTEPQFTSVYVIESRVPSP